MSRSRLFYPILLVFIACQVQVQGQTQADLDKLETFNHMKDVVYKTVAGDDFVLDMIIFFPQEELPNEDRPWTIFVHGGGWGGGDKYRIFGNAYYSTLQTLVENGYVVATIEYRLTRVDISTAYESVVDCKDAARFLLKNAELYSLDTEKYGIWGGSAGGHLSLMAGLGADEDFLGDTAFAGIVPVFKCISSYYPLTSLINPDIVVGSNFENPNRLIPIIGGTAEEEPEMAILLSPTEQLTAESPPILLLHGEEDDILPFANSEYMMEVAMEKGADVQLLPVAGGGHSFSGGDISPSMQAINDSSASFMMLQIQREVVSVTPDLSMDTQNWRAINLRDKVIFHLSIDIQWMAVHDPKGRLVWQNPGTSEVTLVKKSLPRGLNYISFYRHDLANRVRIGTYQLNNR